jgi:N-ethylmaleimide reductase
MLPDGATPVGASPIAATGSVRTASGSHPYETPLELTHSGIARIVQQFAAAAGLAKEAGFDGIELHAANGYLLDQFLRDGANQRTDAYGGSPRNRARLLLEVVRETVSVWGPGKVGVRLSPFNPFNSMSDSHPTATFAEVAGLLGSKQLAYLHIVEPGAEGSSERITPLLRRAFGGALIANGGFTAATAEEALRGGEADAVSFATLFIANPDLPARFATGAELNAPVRSAFYGGGATGYIDYPSLQPAMA